jgi:acetyltransferase-like isoleucine patch superfamily enzyme
VADQKLSIHPPIVSLNSRIRHPDLFEIGVGSILDDYCYISTRVRIGRFSHIANNCSIAGGRDRLFALGDFSSISAGVKIWCGSDDYVQDLVCSPSGGQVKENLILGDVIFDRYTAVGSNSVIMPDNVIPEGVSIGALSYVPPRFKFEPYMVYAGSPIRPLKKRDMVGVQRQAAALEKLILESSQSKS